MKKYIVILLVLLSTSAIANPKGYCEVEVCNKLERLTFSFSKWVSDQIGEQCFDVVIPKKDAVVGKVLKSESRWYQGSSFNPTKKSVTRVSEVKGCN